MQFESCLFCKTNALSELEESFKCDSCGMSLSKKKAPELKVKKGKSSYIIGNNFGNNAIEEALPEALNAVQDDAIVANYAPIAQQMQVAVDLELDADDLADQVVIASNNNNWNVRFNQQHDGSYFINHNPLGLQVACDHMPGGALSLKVYQTQVNNVMINEIQQGAWHFE